MDFAISLALASLFLATLLSNLLARRREKALVFDPITHEARELLLRERAAPVPLCPTLGPEHWARLEAVQPSWRRQVFEAARTRYVEARKAFSRSEIDGELYYPNPALVAGAAHQVLMLTERF
ncbi:MULTISPECIES: hypothetical protein [unclassified Variovorax]|uniref:hypothetical protein n=1 Tax=unclassified Variovorax TaxID=663243 RepID=UPI00076C0260|nr:MULTISPECIES: hypothetical protein [unclassified Variovorax]KWT74688.1 hypothetical protein APY03_5614 [Variovorax sp. WDL1]PNG53072.1 hypothetical protein CHC06_04416 [Variovorax sp. B2]PNG53644.1 hypothetical protein CHC07_03463 [Variovorax sp. B4]VTV11080.1 hypothetical protein WDL1CHR_01977 [Variovorax sp. WDL1]